MRYSPTVCALAHTSSCPFSQVNASHFSRKKALPENKFTRKQERHGVKPTLSGFTKLRLSHKFTGEPFTLASFSF